MKLTQTITFASVKLYRLITIICLIILISHIVQLVLFREFIVSVQVRIFPLNMCGTIIYVAWWWEKYLLKSSLIKHTCSWRDKVIVLWTLNRQIFLRITFCLLNNKGSKWLTLTAFMNGRCWKNNKLWTTIKDVCISEFWKFKN